MTSSNNYHFFCNVCGNQFKVERRDGRTCSDLCRLAMSKVYRLIDEKNNLTPEELAQFKMLTNKIKGSGKSLKTIIPQDKDNSLDKLAEAEAALKIAQEELAKIPTPQPIADKIEATPPVELDKPIESFKERKKKLKGNAKKAE
jgi:CRISPR/Cas system-associated protein Cas10 (large subunit of type III CRISPR-Cas system)